MNKTLRLLLLAVEYLRKVCEHAEGKSERDQAMLATAMRVGTRASGLFRYLVEDYQMPSYWEDVDKVLDMLPGVDIYSRPEDATEVNPSGSKYLRKIPLTEDERVDVYAVLLAFGVTSPPRQHAIKKLLCAGLRGKATEIQDLTEARDAIDRAIQLCEWEKEHRE